MLTILMPIYSHGASFDCSKASTNVEKALCENAWLGRLDEELSYFYSKLRESSSKEELSTLVSTQRAWIKDRNQACEAANNIKACLGDRYRNRVTALKIAYDTPLLPGKDSLKHLCGDIAALDSRGRLEYGDAVETADTAGGVVSYDINNDGINEVAESCLGGTMHAPCVEFKLPNGEPLRTTTINYEWKDYSTFGLRAFAKDGRWFRLHAYDDHFVKPAYLSYMTQNNNEYVVCEFENTEVETFLPNQKIQEADVLCGEVEAGNSGKIVDITLSEPPVMTRSDIRNLGRYETGLERQGNVDYNNDGVPNYVGELEYASGAGRGCDYNYFDELSADAMSFTDSEDRAQLLTMQRVRLKDRHPNCGSWSEGRYMNRFFRFESKVYFELKTRSERAVLKLENNEVDEICSVSKRYETRIGSFGVHSR